MAVAFEIIEEGGVEALSLRDVSRRLGVSHQAPYKHFPSRDHILAEVISRAFTDFARFLEDRPKADDPHADLYSLGLQYMSYARRHPLSYRLMFNTPLPPLEAHPDMMKNAKHAFAILRDRLREAPLKEPGPGAGEAPNLDALFVWSTIHGLASLLQSDALHTLQLSDEEIAAAIPRAMARLSLALEPSAG